jgi:adenylylsulfate kinase
MVIWFTGQPGSGKTTLALALLERWNDPAFIHIDGDDLRGLLNNPGYSTAGRVENICRAQNIALFLEDKGYIPIISLVAPYRALRESFKLRANKVIEIYVHTKEKRGREDHFVEDYEPPQGGFLGLDTGKLSIKECINEILNVCR